MPAAGRFIAAYGVAHFGKSLFWHASELLFAYFLTEACGFAPQTMALILGLSLLLNAVADVIVGRALAPVIAATAAAGRMQFRGALASAAAFCLFGATGLVPPEARVALAVAAILAFRLSYPFFDIPQNAMLALTTENDGGRARLSSYRYIFGGAANILVASVFAPLLQGRLAGVQSINFAGLSLVLSLFAVGGALGLRLNLRAGADPKVAGAGRRRRPASAVFSERRVWLVFAMVLAMSVTGAAFSKLEPYLQAFGLVGASMGAGRSAVLVAIAVGVFVSQPVWSAVAQRLSLLATLRLATVIVAGSVSAFYGGAAWGGWAVALAGVVYGCGCGGVLMCLWALAAAAAGAIPRLGGAAPTFGLVTGVSKLGSGVAVLGVGGLLSLHPYHDPAAWNASLRLIMAMTPAAGALACALMSYRLAPPGRRRAPKPDRFTVAVGP